MSTVKNEKRTGEGYVNQTQAQEKIAWSVFWTIIMTATIWFALNTLVVIADYMNVVTFIFTTLISLVISLLIIKAALHQFNIHVEPNTGVALVNSWTGTLTWLHIPGDNFKFGWDKKQFDIPLDKKTEITSGRDPVDGKAAPEKMPTKNGSVEVEYGFVIIMNVHDIDQAVEYRQATDSARITVTKETLSRILEDEFVTLTNDQALEKKEKLRDLIIKKLKEKLPDGRTLEEQYQIKIVNVQVFDVYLPDRLREAREEQAITEKDRLAARALYGKGENDTMTAEELEIAGGFLGKIDLQVNRVRGFENAKMVSLFPGMIGGAGNDQGNKGGKGNKKQGGQK